MNRRDALKYTSLAFGYAISAGALSTMMQSCQADVEGDGWAPNTLSKAQVDMLAEFGETILPKTDTPGAKDVLVHRYIDEYYTRFFNDENRKKAMDKLGILEQHLNEAGGKQFIKLSAEERSQVLGELNKAAIAAGEQTDDLQKAYLELKGMVINTFFTSEQIGTEVLAYNPVPGPYKGCIDVTEVGKAWSLN